MKIFKTTFYFDNKKIPATIKEDVQTFALSFAYYKPLIEEIKISTENRQWDGRTKTWILKKTNRNRFILNYLVGNNPYTQYDVSLQNYNLGAGLLPTFWQHQQKMYAHIMLRKRVIVAGEMRTGKTRPTLKAIKDLGIEDAWWIAPKSALRGLKNELIKWNFPFKIYLLTYSKFRNMYNGSLEGVPKFIVFDECQKLKNPRSKQGQLAKDLSHAQKEKWGDDRYLVLLSGTPAPKEPSDWWNITEVACAGFLREGSQSLLKQRLGNYEERESEVGQKYWRLINWKKDEVEALSHRLNGLVEVFLKKDCLDLPNKMYNIIKFDIDTDYSQAIGLLQKTETKAAQLLNKLRQLSDGFLYTHTPDAKTATKTKKAKYFEKCPKDKQLKSDLDEFEDIGRLIIYCGFQATIDKLTAICIKKDWTVLKIDGRGWFTLNTTYDKEFCLTEMDGSLNTGKIEKLVFLAQADAASTGLELSASPIIIYYSNSYNGAARMQSEDRAYSNNMDKVRGLEIRDYIHLPVDKLVRDNLLEKKTLQSITMGEIVNSMGNLFERKVI